LLNPRYIMIGGFLGAGKTTAILQIAQRLTAQNMRVGLITNDQSIGLVDTTMLTTHGYATEEISGGCFCCRFNSLVEAAQRLRADVRPDVFLAEPVGSCTDLVATVSYPLRQMYGDEFTVAPLSVLVDPVRAQRVLGLKRGKSFAPKVLYIYEKQLEEADIIVVNKTDLLDDEAKREVVATLAQRYPTAEVVAVSARTGNGMEAWMDAITSLAPANGNAMDVDYDTYADGEAMLGWVNISAELTGSLFDGNRFLAELVQTMGSALQQAAGGPVEIAHLKSTLVPSLGRDIAVANLVRGDTTCELSHELDESLDSGELIVNLRAEGDPQQLQQIALGVLQSVGGRFRLVETIKHAEAFRPGRPTPTHRLVQC